MTARKIKQVKDFLAQLGLGSLISPDDLGKLVTDDFAHASVVSMMVGKYAMGPLSAEQLAKSLDEMKPGETTLVVEPTPFVQPEEPKKASRVLRLTRTTLGLLFALVAGLVFVEIRTYYNGTVLEDKVAALSSSMEGKADKTELAKKLSKQELVDEVALVNKALAKQNATLSGMDEDLKTKSRDMEDTLAAMVSQQQLANKLAELNAKIDTKADNAVLVALQAKFDEAIINDKNIADRAVRPVKAGTRPYYIDHLAPLVGQDRVHYPIPYLTDTDTIGSWLQRMLRTASALPAPKPHVMPDVHVTVSK